MPWHLENRDGKVCVIKDADGSVAGCHDSRTDAIKQQRALYANESRMASMYAALDAQPDDFGWMEEKPPVPAVIEDSLSPFAAQLVGLILKDEREKSLTASLAESNATIAANLQQTAEERMALVAALERIGQPVINLPAPEITVQAAPAPNVTVEAAPQPEVKVDVHVPEQKPVQVTVNPEIVMPQPAPITKTITFERDPLTGQVSSADVTEG